jgi:hypothetical protein
MAAGSRKTGPVEIYTDDMSGRHRLSQTHSDRPLTAAAIEDGHVGPEVRQEKICVDFRAARVDRGHTQALPTATDRQKKRVVIVVGEVAFATIETPFGNIDGHTAADVNRLVVGIISDLRYVDVGATLRALGHVYHASNDADVRKEVDRSVEELTRYDLDVWRQAGPAVQLALVSVIDGLASEDRKALWPILHIVWRECLNTELRGTSDGDATLLSGKLFQ